MLDFKAVTRVCWIFVPVNLLLFGIKLYIGLSTNSISIYSDAVNNFFDALSVLVTAVVLGLMLKKTDARSSGQLVKTEQLFSFLISAVVTFTGFYFAYSALERFMYPTPVWYTSLYMGVLIGTALVKLGMFFLLRRYNRRLRSSVVSAIAADSLLDFFITAMTVLTLILSAAGTFSFDALFGLVISTVIIVSAVKGLLSAAAILIDYVPQKDREEINRILETARNAGTVQSVRYLQSGEKTECSVAVTHIPENAKSLQQEAFEKTKITMYFIEKEEEFNL